MITLSRVIESDVKKVPCPVCGRRLCDAKISEPVFITDSKMKSEIIVKCHKCKSEIGISTQNNENYI